MIRTYSIQTWNQIVDYRRTRPAALKSAEAYARHNGTTVWVFRVGTTAHVAVVQEADEARESIRDCAIAADWAAAAFTRRQLAAETET